MSRSAANLSPRKPWLGRAGCGLLVAAALLALVSSSLFLVARRQIDSMLPALQVVESHSNQSPENLKPPIELHLDLSSAQLVVRPVEGDQAFEIRADYDKGHYVLEAEESALGLGKRLDVTFRPLSPTMAFLRMKAGGQPPEIRIDVPWGQPLRIFGALQTSFAAIEAGGLTLDELALEVDGGAATVSFLSPLTRPMERFSMVGDKGSLEVTGLGNGSPREVVLDQRLGELDLDLRGAWQRDAKIDVKVALAGGICWLPDDVGVRGVGAAGRLSLPDLESPSRPTLDLSIVERGGRLLLIQ